MGRFFWILYLRLKGWNTKTQFPSGLKKCIIIVAPHTSWVDLVMGLAYRSIFKLRYSRFLGKKELFDGPFGFFFRWLGGSPVDRFSKQNVVDQVVDLINSRDEIMIALAPEGTRKRVDRLRTGFYHIAKKAAVPIVMAGLDFSKKEIILSEPFYTTDDEEKDFEKIIRFFAPVQGRYPEKGLSHLLPDNVNQ
ncbi:MAG TPA: 1-acyl-sn-glycerol-3-phosphate acyltransferase [Chitinophagaceae bacterium]|nr:1-acyl-sn-glycerol-3-phosphate acyltransferase [Chitinophagaceae bacterium]